MKFRRKGGERSFRNLSLIWKVSFDSLSVASFFCETFSRLLVLRQRCQSLNSQLRRSFLYDCPIRYDIRDQHVRILRRRPSTPKRLSRTPRVPDEVHWVFRYVDFHPTEFFVVDLENRFAGFPFDSVVVIVLRLSAAERFSTGSIL